MAVSPQSCRTSAIRATLLAAFCVAAPLAAKALPRHPEAHRQSVRAFEAARLAAVRAHPLLLSLAGPETVAAAPSPQFDGAPPPAVDMTGLGD